MGSYILRRLLLLPIALFLIALVNFVIINLAPGDPSLTTQKNVTGEASQDTKMSAGFGSDFRYLSFREWYGLTLPILFNPWPMISREDVLKELESIQGDTLSYKEKEKRKLKLGDEARFILDKLAAIIRDTSLPLPLRKEAFRFFIRGSIGFVKLGPNLTVKERESNRAISRQNIFLQELLSENNEENMEKLLTWYKPHEKKYTALEKVKIFFFETRVFRYFSRLVTLDFGTLRDDPNKTVIHEVVSRFKYSLTLSVLPMVLAFFLCTIFGTWMALSQGSFSDYALNFVFLFLYAIPIFVMAPFLIEEVAIRFGFPFSGFTSPETIYQELTSLERLLDIGKHIALPIVAILYGMLAAQSRLSRTAVLEVARSEYVRFAKAKGLSNRIILFRYIGKNAAITLVTAIAGSLGVILGGSLIVETIFEIDGFGKFFYDAVIGRDYNVIMFSALAGSFLGLVGYLVADLSYAMLDPRVTLE